MEAPGGSDDTASSLPREEEGRSRSCSAEAAMAAAKSLSSRSTEDRNDGTERERPCPPEPLREIMAGFIYMRLSSAVVDVTFTETCNRFKVQLMHCKAEPLCTFCKTIQGPPRPNNTRRFCPQFAVHVHAREMI